MAPKPRKKPQSTSVPHSHAWALFDREGALVEVCKDRAGLPDLCRGERLVRVRLVE